MVYLLVAPLFTFIQGVTAPIPSAEAATVGTSPGNCVLTVSTSSGVTTSQISGTSDCLITITSAANLQITIPYGVTTIRYLAVGGGASGTRGRCNYIYGQGGGGGEVLDSSASVTANAIIYVTVGSGGSAISGSCPGTVAGNAGSASKIGTSSSGTEIANARGGSGPSPVSSTNPNGGASGNGNSGGVVTFDSSGNCSLSQCAAGGGGGAGAAGSGINGGIGISSNITGTSTYFGGGGAGRNQSGSGTAGNGGGATSASCNATANTGGGGSDCSSGTTSGAGGSGVVYIRYTVPNSLTWTRITGTGKSSTPASSMWRDISTTNDGTKIIAASYGNGLWLSSNSGSTFTQKLNGYVMGTAISDDGTKMYATCYANGSGSGYCTQGFYRSIDGGTNWSNTGLSADNFWGVSTSSNGTIVLAVTYSGKIYISSNSGSSFNQKTPPAGSTTLRGTAISSDGTKMYITAGNGILVSNDSGSTWSLKSITGSGPYEISTSSDGSKVATSLYGSATIMYSSDYGSTWTNKTPLGSASTYGISMSGDGSRLIVPRYTTNQIFYSADSGDHWTLQTLGLSSTSYLIAGMNRDGNALYVGGYTGDIHYASPGAVSLTPTFGSATATNDGYKMQISNYDNSYTWSVSPSAGSATINSSGLITVTGLSAGASSTVTVTNSKTGIPNGSASSSGTALSAALTPTFDTTTATSTASGFTIQISNYSASYTWSGTNSASGTISIDGTGLVTVSGLGSYVGSTVSISTSRSGYANGSATSSTYYSQRAALTPTFDTTTATRTAGGFSLKISNYDANYGWNGTTSAAGGSVSISGTGLITVTGLGDGVSSTVSITTTRSLYPNGSATSASYTTLSAALTPTFDTYTATADGFTAILRNYDGTNYTWNATSSKAAGTATISVSGGVATLSITGLGANETSTATVTTTRSGYRQGSATTTVNTSKQNQTLTVTTPSTMTVGDADTSVVASASSGGTITLTSQSTGVCTIVSAKIHAVDAGTCLVSVAQAGTSSYNQISTSITFTINAGSAKVPTFDTPVATATGYTVNVTNYSTSETYTATVSVGSASIGSASGSNLPVTVSGLSANQSSSLTVKTTRPGYATGQTSVSGTSKPGASLSIINVIPTGDGATFQVSATGSTAGTPTAYKTSNSSDTRTVTGPVVGVYTVSGAANGENITINVPWTATSSYAGSGTATTTVNIVSPPDSPTAVTLDTTGLTGDGKLKISWTTPTSNGGSAITRYEYRIAPSGTTSWGVWTATSDTSTSITLTGLPSAKSYIAQVRAVNIAGYSAPSSTSGSGTTTGTAASQRGAPTNFGVTAGDGQLTITFTPPIASGVDAITAYQYRLNSGAWNSLSYTGDTPTVTGTITGLTNGSTYSVGIRGVNAFGPGLEGSTSGRPATTPSVPTGLAISAGTGQLTITFTALTPTQSGVNDSTTVVYQYQSRVTAGTWSSWSDSSTSTSRTITGITNNAIYEVRIRALNNAGLYSDSSTAVSTNATQAQSPTITVQPLSKNLTSGQSSFTLTVTATKSGVSSEVLSYQWYKDGVALASETSTATFETSTVTSSSAGSYTVKVYARVNSTVASTTSSAATVTVNGAPTVTSSTLADTATVNSAFTQTLTASGGTGSYTWTGSGLPAGMSLSSAGVLSGTPTTINSAATFTVYVTDSNSITSANKTITLRIAPAVSISTSSLGAGKKSTSYSQSLKASGGSGIYTWSVDAGTLPDGLSLNTLTGSITGTPSSTSSAATITFKATDSNGSNTTKSLLIDITSGVPSAPSSLTFNSADDGSVSLTWTAPSDNGGSAIDKYIISVYAAKTGDDDEDNNSITIAASGITFPYKVTGLKNGRSYKISVSAKNASATGPASNEITASPGKVADAPKSISAVRASNGISVRWKKTDNEYGFSTTSYSLRCRASGGSYFNAVTDQSPGKGDDDYYSVTLTAGTYDTTTVSYGTAYSCQVRGKSSAGYSAWSTETSPLTLAKIPKAPTLASYDTSTAVGKISVVMNKPSGADYNGYDTITAYGVTLKNSTSKEDDDDESERSCTSTRPSGSSGNTWDAQSTYNCTLTGTPTKGSFVMYLYAINSIGKSAYETFTVTMPGKSQTITVSSLTISKKVGDSDFSIGASTNSGLKPTYAVKSGSTTICSITSSGFVHIIRDGDCYITISQNGRTGGDDDEDSEYSVATSVEVKVAIANIPPGVPSFASIVPANAKVTVNWNAPSGGGTVASYDLQYSSDGGTTWEPNPTPLQTSSDVTSARKLEITSLVNGKSYFFRIRSTSGALASSWVTSSTSYVPFGPPSKPVISSVAVTATSSSALVSWTAPANNGDTITAYSVRATSGTYLSSCSVGGTTYSCTIGSLQNKNTYSFTLIASNRAGTSDTSTAVTAYVDGLSQTITVPSDKIPALKGWYVGDPDVQLVSSASSGLAIQYASTNTSICTVSNSGVVHFVAEGTCQVTIKQDGSNSKYNAAPDATPIQMVISPVLPSAPTITKVEWDSTGLKVTWTAPSRTGGGTLSYTATASPGKSGSGTATCTTSSLTCIIPGGGGSGVDAGTLETIYVTAAISAGSGPASDTKTATWYTNPSAPTTDSGHTSNKSNTNGRAIDVYWKKSDSVNGSAIIRYTATAGSQSCSVPASSALDSSNYYCQITGLTAGTSNAVTVKATNAAGDSSALSIGSFTPGIAQTITLNPVTTSYMKSFGDPNFTVSATINSGKSPSYTSSDNSVITVSSSGVIAITGVGSATITVSQSGDSDYLAATSAVITVTVNPVAPGKPVITSLSPRDGAVLVKWKDPSFLGTNLGVKQYVLVSGATTQTVDCSGSASSGCLISSLSNGQTYQLKIREVNSANATLFADSDLSDDFQPFSNLSAPIPVTLSPGISAGLSTLVATWESPTAIASGLTLDHYVVYLANADKSLIDSATATSSDRSKTFTTFKGSAITNGSKYWIQVRAVGVDTASVYFDGDLSNWVSAKTFTVPDAPITLTLKSGYSSGAPNITGSWTTPTFNGGSDIDKYDLTLTSGATTFTCSSNHPTTSCTVTGLAPGTTYTGTVTAHNSLGNSVASSSTTATTFTVPSAPTGVNATADSSTALITINWNAPSDSGGATITGYTATVTYSPSGSTLTCTTAGVTCTISGGLYKESATVTIIATNIAGNSTNSTAGTLDAINKTQVITFDNPGNKVLNDKYLTLDASATSGLSVSFTSSTTAVCTVSSKTVTFVTSGTCTITAAQSGNSIFDAASNVTQSFTVSPSAPAIMTLAQVQPGANSLTVRWNAADTSALNGSTFMSYTVSWATASDFSDESSKVISTQSDTSTTLSGLKKQTVYYVRIQLLTASFTSISDSRWSNVLTGTPFGLPSAPDTVGVTVFTDVPGSMTVTWATVTNDGGTPITGYTAEAYSDVSGTVSATGLQCTNSGNSCVISGLNGPTYYYFKVFATNAVGNSTLTSTASSSRAGLTQTISATSASVSHDKVTYQVLASSTSGLPLKYSVKSQIKDTNADSDTICSVDENTGVLTLYSIGQCVVQMTQDGTDATGTPTSYLEAVAETATITVTYGLPSGVQNLSVTPGDKKLVVTWTVPSDLGGALITGYRVTWFPSDARPTEATLDAFNVNTTANTDWTIGGRLNVGNVLTYTILNLENGKTYRVIVQAINAAGGMATE